jgi:hypothetical protein
MARVVVTEVEYCAEVPTLYSPPVTEIAAAPLIPLTVKVLEFTSVLSATFVCTINGKSKSR